MRPTAFLVDVAGLLVLGLVLGLFDLGGRRLAVLGLLALDDLDAHLGEMAITSSICSELFCSGGRTAFSSSKVM